MRVLSENETHHISGGRRMADALGDSGPSPSVMKAGGSYGGGGGNWWDQFWGGGGGGGGGGDGGFSGLISPNVSINNGEVHTDYGMDFHGYDLGSVSNTWHQGDNSITGTLSHDSSGVLGTLHGEHATGNFTVGATITNHTTTSPDHVDLQYKINDNLKATATLDPSHLTAGITDTLFQGNGYSITGSATFDTNGDKAVSIGFHDQNSTHTNYMNLRFGSDNHFAPRGQVQFLYNYNY